jgi:hypothetical protein
MNPELREFPVRDLSIRADPVDRNKKSGQLAKAAGADPEQGEKPQLSLPFFR